MQYGCSTVVVHVLGVLAASSIELAVVVMSVFVLLMVASSLTTVVLPLSAATTAATKATMVSAVK